MDDYSNMGPKINTDINTSSSNDYSNMGPKIDISGFSGEEFTNNQSAQDIQNAQQYIGNQSENGECQQFVEKMVYGKTGLFPSAAAAANYYRQQGQLSANWQNMKPGDMIYFQPDESNNYDGHVGLYEGQGRFISATYNGVQDNSLQNWMQNTGQQIMGFVPGGGQ